MITHKDDIESRLQGVTAELEKLKSDLASINSMMDKLGQEFRIELKNMEMKQAMNQVELSHLTEKLSALTAKVESVWKDIVDRIEEIWDAFDSHYHEVTTLPNGKTKTVVKPNKNMR